MIFEIKKIEDIYALTDEYGFLPFFKSGITGFSIEENTDINLLWGKNTYGPWEWKGPIIREGKYAYGKFFCSKAGYISPKMLPHFANYRRDGYDFDSLCDEGLVPQKDMLLYNAVDVRKSVSSVEIRRVLGLDVKPTAYDAILSKLMMQSYLCNSDFVYSADKNGKNYGWGVACYSTLEYMYGEEIVRSAYNVKPEDSFTYMVDFLKSKFPEADEKKIIKLLKRK